MLVPGRKGAHGTQRQDSAAQPDRGSGRPRWSNPVSDLAAPAGQEARSCGQPVEQARGAQQSRRECSSAAHSKSGYRRAPAVTRRAPTMQAGSPEGAGIKQQLAPPAAAAVVHHKRRLGG